MHFFASLFTLILSSGIFHFYSLGQQNLVPNSSFEEYNFCPSTSGGFSLTNCKYWKSPTLATPDYFNSCSTDYDPNTQTQFFSVPQNFYGYQEAHSGNAYGAFVYNYYDNGVPPYSEYVQVELENQLEAGKFYEIRFFINNAIPDFCINSIGALFTPSELNINSIGIISLTPQIVSHPNTFFCDTINWQEVKGTFSASGNEKYLTIGVFNEPPELLFSDYQGNQIQGSIVTYFYIDDVSVTETTLPATNSTEMATIFTPNGDGINDVLIFPFPESIADKKVSILNRWGSLIYEAELKDFNWNGKTSNGTECSEGTYFYRISDVNISGFVELIR